MLRKLSVLDVDVLLAWENDPEVWGVSQTTETYSRKDIETLVNEPQEIGFRGQLRFMIVRLEDQLPVGCVDLFDYDPIKQQAEVGILIDKAHRKQGLATQALIALKTLCRNELQLVHLFCNIFNDNLPSIRLFENAGFVFKEERMLEGKRVNYYELKDL